MINAATGTRAMCRDREIWVRKEASSSRYMISVDEKYGSDAEGRNAATAELRKLGCSSNQIKSMMEDLETYYMNE